MASGRHDYRDPAKEKFGKPTTSYDEGSLLHPKLTDVLASRKDSTSGTTPFLTPHDKLKETVLTSQSSTKGDDDSTNAQLVYETLPGPVKVSFETDSRTKIVGTIWEQFVAASDNPSDRGFVKGGIFQMTANFANGNTVTIGAITYTAQTTLTNVAGHFLIASTLTESLLNLVQAIIAGHGSGTRYASATTANASCSAWSTQDQLVVASTTGGTIATTTASAGAWTGSTTTLIFKVEYKATDTVVKSMRIVTYSILDNYSAVFANTADINFPEVLTALTVYWSTSIGEGTNTEAGAMDVNGTSNVQLGLDVRASAQGSTSIIPELIPTISKIYGESMPVTDYYFFLPLPVTQAQILSRLTVLAGSTVNAWPIFKPVPRTFILDGKKLSASLEGNLHYKVSVDTTGTSTGKSSGVGRNFDAGSSVRAVTLPPMLNAALSVKNSGGTDESTKTQSATVDTSAAISDSGVGMSVSDSLTLVSQASVTPASIGATSPAALPSSGLYLLRCDTELFRDGYAACRARVFDFAALT